MKKIKKYSEVQDKLEELQEAMVKPPFPSEITVDVYCNFYGNELILHADEALKLGRWLVDFYGTDIKTTKG